MLRIISLATFVGGLLALPWLEHANGAAPAATTSVIFVASDPGAIDGFAENPEATRRMVDHLVEAVTQESDLGRAWRTLVAPTDRIGIKVSTAGGRYFSSHRGVVSAIISGLEAAGISSGKVVVWDRTTTSLRSAGFIEGRGGYRVRGIDPPLGFDPAARITAPMFGKLIWGDFGFAGNAGGLRKASIEADQESAESHVASILSKEVTKVINVPVFSDEEGCGVAGALYNMTIPNIDNNRRFTQSSGASSIIDLYGNRLIGPKVVLHIMDGLVAQFAGGPSFNPNYAFAHHTLYASKDPVALDSNAARCIDRWRAESNLPRLGEHAAWIQEGEVMNLGHSAENAIELKLVPSAP